MSKSFFPFGHGKDLYSGRCNSCYEPLGCWKTGHQTLVWWRIHLHFHWKYTVRIMIATFLMTWILAQYGISFSVTMRKIACFICELANTFTCTTDNPMIITLLWPTFLHNSEVTMLYILYMQRCKWSECSSFKFRWPRLFPNNTILRICDTVHTIYVCHKTVVYIDCNNDC